MKRTFQRMIPACALALLSIGALFVYMTTPAYAASRQIAARYSFHHATGAFVINTAQEASEAASNGLNEAQMYKLPATTNDPLGQALQSLNMHEVDSYLEILLYEYECHRSHVVSHSGPSCPMDYPNMTSVSVLLSLAQSHLQQAAGNALINAYWVLDDWNTWDDGGAKSILQQIHAMIQQYTPNRPAICGFGAQFGYHGDDYWYDPLADNFSPQGCDMVGLYIYAALVPPQYHPNPDSFEWSMSTILPKMFNSLKQRGWGSSKEPLVGIGQGFAGVDPTTQYYAVQPSAQDMTRQALSFCQHGASSVFFFGWDVSASFSNPQTPMNNSTLAQGVQQGIAACKGFWGGHAS